MAVSLSIPIYQHFKGATGMTSLVTLNVSVEKRLGGVLSVSPEDKYF